MRAELLPSAIACIFYLVLSFVIIISGFCERPIKAEGLTQKGHATRTLSMRGVPIHTRKFVAVSKRFARYCAGGVRGMSSSSFAWSLCAVHCCRTNLVVFHCSEQDPERIDRTFGIQYHSHWRLVAGESRKEAWVDLKVLRDRVRLVFLEKALECSVPGGGLRAVAGAAFGSRS